MISHDHQLIFIHIPKCAGRSVMKLFNSARPDHFTYFYYSSEYERYMGEYKVFTIVRHPLDRMVSTYHYVKGHRRNKNEPIAKGFTSFRSWLLSNMAAYEGCDLTSPEGQWSSDGQLGSPFWFSPQKRWLMGDDHETDIEVFKYEDLSKVESLLQEVFSDYEIKLPHLNKSDHKPWQEYYDMDLLEVCKHFKPIQIDMQAFGYTI
jgi:hypothetical protein